jgi:hypothetical protein
VGEALAATGDADGSRAAYRRGLELARGIHGREEPQAREWIEEAEKALGEHPAAP